MQDACQIVQRHRELPLLVPPPADKALANCTRSLSRAKGRNAGSRRL